MADLGAGEMERHEAGHPFPRPAAAAALAAATDRLQPEARNALEVSVHLAGVERHGMVSQPTVDHTPQPASRFPQRTVHPLAEFLTELMERRPQAFAAAVAMDCEPPVCPRLGGHMGETQKLERLRSALAPPFSVFRRMTAEFDQAGFLAFGVPDQTWPSARGAPPDRRGPRTRVGTPSQSHPHTAPQSPFYGSDAFATTRSTGRTHSAGTHSPTAVKDASFGETSPTLKMANLRDVAGG
jgi:hypothetical protein